MFALIFLTTISRQIAAEKNKEDVRYQKRDGKD
jgi:hypothetical protein